mgnify:CR=1 FL=1
MSEYVITTDNNSDLPEEYLKDHGVGCMYLSYSMDGKNYTHGNFLPEHEFYEAMRNGSMPTTAQVNPENAKALLEPYLKEGKDILHLAFSSGLSGSCQSARIAAEELQDEYPERKIVVIDTLLAALGQGLLVYKAVQLKEQGASMDEVADWGEKNKDYIASYVTVDDLFHLYRGGRVSRSSAVLGSMVGIKPIIRVNEEGKLEVIGKVRGRKKAIQTIIKDLMERIRDGEKTVFISHGDCLEEAETIKQKLITDYGMEDVQIEYVGPVIGAHTGVGVLAVFALANSR